MDPTLPQMPSFEFDRLDPVALEQTLAWFKENPEVPAWEDYEGIGPGGYTGMLEGDGGMDDLAMDDGLQDAAETARQQPRILISAPFMENIEHSLGSGRVGSHSMALLHCTWEGCESQFGSTSLKTHLESHAREASRHWTRRTRCLWKGCQSRANFATKNLYEQHLRNVHTQPLICTEPRCSYRKPFRDQLDLERHRTTKHAKERDYRCPYINCPAEIQTFKRKDKLLLHIRETVHDNDAYCPSYHCQAKQCKTASRFTTRKQISAHFGKHHETNAEEAFRCTLGSCSNNPTHDCWEGRKLQEHLRDCHGISHNYPLYYNCKDAGSRAFDIEHFTSQDPNETYCNYTGPWHDCTICAPRAQAHDGELPAPQESEKV